MLQLLIAIEDLISNIFSNENINLMQGYVKFNMKNGRNCLLHHLHKYSNVVTVMATGILLLFSLPLDKEVEITNIVWLDNFNSIGTA